MDENEPLVAGVELGGTKCIAVLARGPAIIAEERIETGDATPTLAALRAIMVKGVGFWAFKEQVLALLIFAFVTAGVSVLRLRRQGG